MEHKYYGLLETGVIVPLYYSNGDMRRIEYEGGDYYLYYDKYITDGNNKVTGFAYCRSKIIKEANSKEELQQKGSGK